MEFFGVLVGMAVLTLVVLVAALFMLLPLFWVWMLADAIVREASTFPSRDNVEKIVWIVLMLTVQPVVVLYFLLVWRTQERVQLWSRASAPAAPTPFAA